MYLKQKVFKKLLYKLALQRQPLTTKIIATKGHVCWGGGGGGGQGNLGIFGCGCATDIQEPYTYTRASSAELYYPMLD